MLVGQKEVCTFIKNFAAVPEHFHYWFLNNLDVGICDGSFTCGNGGSYKSCLSTIVHHNVVYCACYGGE